jgi:hypothetical protein
MPPTDIMEIDLAGVARTKRWLNPNRGAKRFDTQDRFRTY